MSGETLRRAAVKLRDHLDEVPSGPWTAVREEVVSGYAEPSTDDPHSSYYCDTTVCSAFDDPEDVDSTYATARYIALMHPEVAVLVADLLDAEAHLRETQPRGFYEVAECDPLALQILGEEA